MLPSKMVFTAHSSVSILRNADLPLSAVSQINESCKQLDMVSNSAHIYKTFAHQHVDFQKISTCVTFNESLWLFTKAIGINEYVEWNASVHCSYSAIKVEVHVVGFSVTGTIG
jgi:hypothetical protein